MRVGEGQASSTFSRPFLGMVTSTHNLQKNDIQSEGREMSNSYLFLSDFFRVSPAPKLLSSWLIMGPMPSRLPRKHRRSSSSSSRWWGGSPFFCG